MDIDAAQKQQFIKALYKKKTIQRACESTRISYAQVRKWRMVDEKFDTEILDFKDWLCDLYEELALKKLQIIEPETGIDGKPIDADRMKWLNDNLLLGMLRMNPRYRDPIQIHQTLQLQIKGVDMGAIANLSKKLPDADGITGVDLEGGPKKPPLPQSIQDGQQMTAAIKEQKDLEESLRDQYADPADTRTG